MHKNGGWRGVVLRTEVNSRHDKAFKSQNNQVYLKITTHERTEIIPANITLHYRISFYFIDENGD